MSKERNLEQERKQLLQEIEAALPPKVQEALKAICQPSQKAKVVLSKNEVGSEHAD